MVNKIIDASSAVASASGTASKVIDMAPDVVANEDILIPVAHPHLWSVNDPYLYKLLTQVSVNGKVVDRYTTSFGIRYFKFDKDSGFSLNGQPLKILGVC